MLTAPTPTDTKQALTVARLLLWRALLAATGETRTEARNAYEALAVYILKRWPEDADSPTPEAVEAMALSVKEA